MYILEVFYKLPLAYDMVSGCIYWDVTYLCHLRGLWLTFIFSSCVVNQVLVFSFF